MNNCFVSYCNDEMRLPTRPGRDGFSLVVGSLYLVQYLERVLCMENSQDMVGWLK